MRQFKIVVEIHIDRNRKTFEEFIVEAGNKKLASIRGLQEVSKKKDYDGLFKSIVSVEEIKN